MDREIGCALLVMAVAFKHLHFVSIRVLDEEVTGDQRAVICLELLYVQRAVTKLQQPRPVGQGIGYAHAHMAITIAMGIGLTAVAVPGQLNFGIVLGIAQLYQ